jgi:hypothetical protein
MLYFFKVFMSEIREAFLIWSMRAVWLVRVMFLHLVMLNNVRQMVLTVSLRILLLCSQHPVPRYPSLWSSVNLEGKFWSSLHSHRIYKQFLCNGLVCILRTRHQHTEVWFLPWRHDSSVEIHMYVWLQQHTMWCEVSVVSEEPPASMFGFHCWL